MKRTRSMTANTTANIVKESTEWTEKDKSCVSYVVGKTARIIAALLRVLDSGQHVGDVERSLTKQTALRLVRDATGVQGTQVRYSNRALEVAALIECLVLAKHIEADTANILLEELSAIVAFVRAVPWGERSLDISLLTLEQPDLSSKALQTPPYPAQRQITDNNPLQDGARVVHRDRMLSGGVRDTMRERKSRTDRSVTAQKDRRATILSILQRKDKISVRDAAEVIKDCSEKTLQRELLTLVAQGVLVKEGERRWSVYRLA